MDFCISITSIVYISSMECCIALHPGRKTIIFEASLKQNPQINISVNILPGISLCDSGVTSPPSLPAAAPARFSARSPLVLYLTIWYHWESPGLFAQWLRFRQECEQQRNNFRNLQSEVSAAYLSLMIERTLKSDWGSIDNGGQCSPQMASPSVGRRRGDRGRQYGHINHPYYMCLFLLWNASWSAWQWTECGWAEGSAGFKAGSQSRWGNI